MIDSRIFQPPPKSYDRTRDSLADFSLDVVFDMKHVYVVSEASSKANTTCLWFHGNASSCGLEASAIRGISERLDVHVVAVEFPGYPPAPGTPSVASLDVAAMECWKYAKHRFPNAKDFIVFGRSLGTGICARLAEKMSEAFTPPKLVVLWSTINSVSGVAGELFGVFGSLFVAKKWDVVDSISRVRAKGLLLICGGRDQLTPFQMAKEVHDASVADYKFVHTNDAASHNEYWNFETDVVLTMQQSLSVIDQEESYNNLVGEFTENQQPNNSNNNNENFVLEKRVGILEAKEHVSNVTIVGAGPVGLWTALCLSKLGIKDVVVFEKYEAYQRHHVLKLEKSSFQGADEELVALCKHLVGTTKTSLLEETLSNACKERKIKIVKNVMVDDFAPIFEKSKVLIGCDGSKSIVRDNVMKGEHERESLQHVLDVRFHIKRHDGSKPEKLNFMQLLSGFKQVEHIVEESIGSKMSNEEEKTYPATLRLLISAKEHEILRNNGSTLRSPLKLPEHAEMVPLSVFETIRCWLLVRRTHFPEEIYSQMSCTSIDLSVYRAKTFAERRSDNKTVWIAGDSGKKNANSLALSLIVLVAFGVPFFRALNNGLLCGTELSKCIAAELNSSTVRSAVCPELQTRKISTSYASFQSREGGFFSSLSASMGMSKNLSDVSALGATQMMEDMMTGQGMVSHFLRYCLNLLKRMILVSVITASSIVCLLESFLWQKRNVTD